MNKIKLIVLNLILILGLSATAVSAYSSDQRKTPSSSGTQINNSDTPNSDSAALTNNNTIISDNCGIKTNGCSGCGVCNGQCGSR